MDKQDLVRGRSVPNRRDCIKDYYIYVYFLIAFRLSPCMQICIAEKQGLVSVAPKAH